MSRKNVYGIGYGMRSVKTRAYEFIERFITYPDIGDIKAQARKSIIGRTPKWVSKDNPRGNYRSYLSSKAKRTTRRHMRKIDRQNAKRLCSEGYNDYIDQLDLEYELWCEQTYKEEREMYYKYAFDELDDYFNRLSVDDPETFYGSIAV